ncbi:HAD family hydrolase [Motiliproteus sp.]|uniref:HAD family hydrolase n=1 Tax=Motiliproteus sp. TaxID=1898955 RepID=UPI003BAB0AF2
MKLIIFDWDGTLIDSADRIINCMQQAASDCELPVPGAEAVRNIIGLGLPEVFELLFGGLDDHQEAQMRERYKHYYIDRNETPTEFFPGVIEGLQRLREQDYCLAVATGKSRMGLDRVFEETGLGEMFDHSRCADETRSKPHPLMLEELLQESGVGRERALMVGDTEYDLEMAAKAGVASVGVSYGAHHPDRLQAFRPKLVIDHFSELECWLKGLPD